MKNILKKNHKKSERGQAIIIIAASLVGMIAIVGLMIDGGILLIEYARLKRGIDSASVAAASQFRLNFSGPELEKAGQEFLKFNQSDAEVKIATCHYPDTTWDETLCVPAAGPTPRKLVRVTATRHVNFGFMKVVGINGTDISATSIGEAASLDMILVIDTSGSMAYETTGNTLDPDYAINCPSGVDCVDPNKSDPASTGHPDGDNPKVCNQHMSVGDPKRCQPLGGVIDVALDFVGKQFFPYDRIAVIASTEQQLDGTAKRIPYPVLAFNDNQDASGNPTTEIQTALRNLKVHQPDNCDQPTGPCLIFDPATTPPAYKGQKCVPYQTPPDYDPTTCGVSNIGGALYLAGDQFAYGRQEAFWVVINLFGGPANATSPTTETPPVKPNGFCPPNTWDLGGLGFCRDLDAMPSGYNWAAYKADPNNYVWPADDWEMSNANRHYRIINNLTTPPTITYPADYDADDYARDAADYITSPNKGQGAVLFSICMGTWCRVYPNPADPATAQRLGQYMAYHAGDDLTVTPKVIANHGLYSYAAGTSDLGPIFTAIAKNIQTRISQ